MINDQENPEKQFPATEPDPNNGNGQGKHEGVPHAPEEFIKPQDPNKGKTWPSVPRVAKPNTAMCEDRIKPGFIDKDEDCGSE